MFAVSSSLGVTDEITQVRWIYRSMDFCVVPEWRKKNILRLVYAVSSYNFKIRRDDKFRFLSLCLRARGMRIISVRWLEGNERGRQSTGWKIVFAEVVLRCFFAFSSSSYSHWAFSAFHPSSVSPCAQPLTPLFFFPLTFARAFFFVHPVRQRAKQKLRRGCSSLYIVTIKSSKTNIVRGEQERSDRVARVCYWRRSG